MSNKDKKKYEHEEKSHKIKIDKENKRHEKMHEKEIDKVFEYGKSKCKKRKNSK